MLMVELCQSSFQFAWLTLSSEWRYLFCIQIIWHFNKYSFSLRVRYFQCPSRFICPKHSYICVPSKIYAILLLWLNRQRFYIRFLLLPSDTLWPRQSANKAEQDYIVYQPNLDSSFFIFSVSTTCWTRISFSEGMTNQPTHAYQK